MVTSITLIRHAASDTVSYKDSNKKDPSITSAGKKQALKTAFFLKGVSFSKIYTSVFARALETAEIITKEEKTKSEDLNEFNKIIFEEQPEDVEKFNDNMLQALKAKEFFEKILRVHRDCKVLIIAHGNVIRYLICSALKLKHQRAPNIFIDNASITNLFFDGNDLVSVGCINSTAHLFLNE
jgi:broad specificity phosphatase PhoE